MMSLAAPVASAVPARVQRRARPHAVANARATALGAGWAHGGSSARALKARARVTAPRRATAAPAQAKTLEERIASGEFTQSTQSPLLWGLNNLRDTIKNVAPQSTCLILRRARQRDETREVCRWNVSIAFLGSGRRFGARLSARVLRVSLFLPRRVPPREPSAHHDSSPTLARIALTGEHFSILLFPPLALRKNRPRFVVPAGARRAAVAQGRPREDARRDGRHP